MPTSQFYDFVIVGAGMAGASLAAELAPHARVLVIEAEDMPGYHATGRSAAFWVESYGGPQVQPLTAASGPWLEAQGFLTNRGGLNVARADQLARLDQFEAAFSGSTIRMERWDRQRMEACIPGLLPEWVEAVHEPDSKDIEVAGLHAYYLSRARTDGAAVICNAGLTGAERRGGCWHLTLSQTEVVRADILINAAGAWADVVAQVAGVRQLGIRPYRRTMMQLRVMPRPPAEMPVVLDIGEQFYFKPESGALWLSPHDETPSPPCDAAPEEMDVAVAINRLQTVVDWTVERVEHRWAGLRSFAPDRLPVYGRDARCEAFFWFAGQGGFGIQTAPAAARLAAQLLLGRPGDTMTATLDAELYSPVRFSKP